MSNIKIVRKKPFILLVCTIISLSFLTSCGPKEASKETSTVSASLGETREVPQEETFATIEESGDESVTENTVE